MLTASPAHNVHVAEHVVLVVGVASFLGCMFLRIVVAFQIFDVLHYTKSQFYYKNT